MGSVRRMAILALGCALLLGACGGHKSGEPADAGSGKVLNLYIWSDYLAQDTLVGLREGERHQDSCRVLRHQ